MTDSYPVCCRRPWVWRLPQSAGRRVGHRDGLWPCCSICLKIIEMLKKSPLGRRYGPGREKVRFNRGRQGRPGAEKSSRLCGTEASERCCFQECGAAIGRFDDGNDFSRQIARQSETQMNRLQQAMFNGLVGAADYHLERRDHVADHVFGGIVEQQCKGQSAIASAAATARNLLGQQSVLRYREDVVAVGLSVPARHTGEAVGNILDLDVQRRRIEEIEPAARQHALPRPRCSAMGPLLAHFAGERPSIFAISSSRLSAAGSVFAFPDRILSSGGGGATWSVGFTVAFDAGETCSVGLTVPFDALTPSRTGLRNGGDSERPGERAPGDGGAADSVGLVGRRNAASSRCAISARLFSSDCAARDVALAARLGSPASLACEPDSDVACSRCASTSDGVRRGSGGGGGGVRLGAPIPS